MLVAPLLVVAAALISPDNTVLLQRRRIDRHHGGLWEFPGGKVEEGEALGTALARELDEELSIGVDPSELIPVSFAEGLSASGRPLVILLYRCDRWNGDPCVSEADRSAGAEIAWLDPRALDHAASQEGQMPPLDAVLAKAVISSLK